MERGKSSEQVLIMAAPKAGKHVLCEKPMIRVLVNSLCEDRAPMVPGEIGWAVAEIEAKIYGSSSSDSSGLANSNES